MFETGLRNGMRVWQWETLSDRYLNELLSGCQSPQLSDTSLGDPEQLVSSGAVLPVPVIL